MRKVVIAILALALAGCGPRSAPEEAASPAAVESVAAGHDEHGHAEGAEAGHAEGAEAGHAEGEEAGHAESGEAGHDEHGGAGGPVTLSREAQEKAGITVEPARVRPVHETLETTGHLEADPDRRVDVTSRAPGRVLKLYAGVGQAVRAGDPLVVLDSVELAEALLEYRDAELRVGLAQGNLARQERLARLGDETRRPLEEAREEQAEAEAAAEAARAENTVAEGRRARVRQLHQEGIASDQQRDEAEAAGRAARARLRQAEERLRIARGRVAREQSLARQGVRVEREVQEARGELERARVDLAHAAEVLQLFGASPGAGATLTLEAPRSGIVVARPVNEGQAVSAETSLMTLQDTSTLLAWVDLREEDLGQVREGMPVQVATPAFPGRTFSGTLTHLAPDLDPRSRMARARAEIANPAGLLKSEMYVSALVSLAGTREAVVVPASAVQRVEGKDVVYVASAPERFERRVVKTGLREGEWQEIASGLKAGEEVVVQGAFMVRGEDQKEEIGGHDH